MLFRESQTDGGIGPTSEKPFPLPFEIADFLTERDQLFFRLDDIMQGTFVLTDNLLQMRKIGALGLKLFGQSFLFQSDIFACFGLLLHVPEGS